MKTSFFSENNNLYKEQRLAYLSPSETVKNAPSTTDARAEMSGPLHNEAYLALDRIGRYREELSKKLNNLNKNSSKYKLYEKTYNELTDIQEKLEKTLEQNDEKKQTVISETFNKINRIFTNPHLSVLRALMISRQLKEIKNAFETTSHIRADKVIPLFSLLLKLTNSADVADGNTYDVKGILVRKEGDKMRLWINGKYYEFKPQIKNGKWLIFDKDRKPLENIAKPVPIRSVMEGLNEIDYKQKTVQIPEEVNKGPELIKRVPEKKPESIQPVEVSKEVLLQNLSQLHNKKSTIDDLPDLQNYLKNKINKTTKKPEVIKGVAERDGNKYPIEALISCVTENNQSFYRISTEVEGKTAVNYLGQGAENKKFAGKDYIAEKQKENEAKTNEEQKRIAENIQAVENFKSDWRNLDDFIVNMETTDRPLSLILSDYGFRPPFTSNEIDDRNDNRYTFKIEDNNAGGTLKIENQKRRTAGSKYIALEKTGANPVKINKEPERKSLNETFEIKKGPEKEPKNAKEWRLAALKPVNDLFEKVKSNDDIKQFKDELIKDDDIQIKGRTLENKAEIYGKYTEIAVRFKNKISYAKESLQNPGAPLEELENNINNALAILPKKSQNIYMAKFIKEVERNIMLARKQAPAEGGKPQA